MEEPGEYSQKTTENFLKNLNFSMFLEGFFRVLFSLEKNTRKISKRNFLSFLSFFHSISTKFFKLLALRTLENDSWRAKCKERRSLLKVSRFLNTRLGPKCLKLGRSKWRNSSVSSSELEDWRGKVRSENGWKLKNGKKRKLFRLKRFVHA